MRDLSIRPTFSETRWGWAYLPLQLLVLPMLLVTLNGRLPAPMPAGILNILLYTLNFVCVICIFWRFLWVSLKSAAKSPFFCLRGALFGLVLYYIGSDLLSALILLLQPDFRNINDQSITQMLHQYPLPMQLCTVFLVPLTEEVLFRGLLFQGLYPKYKIAAYGLSAAVFAAIHVAGYVGLYGFGRLALCFVQYLPAGLALGYAYAKADSIWAPILMHMTINQIAVNAMR